MNLSKYKKQNISIVKKNQPELYDGIRQTLAHLSEEDQGRVAGLIIEYVILSKGDIDIFSPDGTVEDWEAEE